MDEEDFLPRLGRIRSAASPRGRRYLHNVLAATARAGGLKRRSARRFAGSRFGRGSVAARALGQRDRFSGLRQRRAIVKTRLVRLGGRALAAAGAHLRYIQRDGATRDGEPGRLYSAAEDETDGKAFLERCGGDRHQFRLILSAEDGAEYEELRPLVRRFMARMEHDLGTRLDWVAADHLDTLHPHSHVVLRGRDERGDSLVIAPDYIRHGMRERLAGLVSLDLGPRTDLEIQRRLRLEVESERPTSIDRKLLRDMDGERIVGAGGRDMFDHSLRAGRLRKLGSLGLAEEMGQGRWRLGAELERVLRSLGERGDIIRTLQRELKTAGMERSLADQLIFSPDAGASVTGRVVARGLADELRDHHYLVIDGLDGRSHYVAVGKGGAVEPLFQGAIVRIAPRLALVRASDERIAAIAEQCGGLYSLDLHLACEPRASAGFAEAHVRRLEAIRRSVGTLERSADGSWPIPPDFLVLARRHEERSVRDRPVEVELLSAVPLERLPAHEGATWLDRVLASDEQWPRDCGFGRDVRSALALRRAWLIEQELATVDNNRFSLRPDAIAVLERRELSRVGDALCKETGLDYLPARPGSPIEGVVRRRLDLESGRFAMIDNGREFSLVPWRPVLERAFGKPVRGKSGAGGGFSWTISRERGIER